MTNNQTTDGNYRYAFQGQEKDGETGMEAFELRLWDGRLGRWLSIDPYGQYFSPYQGNGNNPILFVDKSGGFAYFYNGCCDWFKFSAKFTIGKVGAKFKVTKNFEASLGGKFGSVGINEKGDVNIKVLSGNGSLKVMGVGLTLNADAVKGKFIQKKKSYFGYQKGSVLSIGGDFSFKDFYNESHSFDVISHNIDEGFDFIKDNSPSKTLNFKNISFSDSYDLGANLKMGIIDVDFGINFQELSQDISQGINDLWWLIENGWGPIFEPIGGDEVSSSPRYF